MEESPSQSADFGGPSRSGAAVFAALAHALGWWATYGVVLFVAQSHDRRFVYAICLAWVVSFCCALMARITFVGVAVAAGIWLFAVPLLGTAGVVPLPYKGFPIGDMAAMVVVGAKTSVFYWTSALMALLAGYGPRIVGMTRGQ